MATHVPFHCNQWASLCTACSYKLFYCTPVATRINILQVIVIATLYFHEILLGEYCPKNLFSHKERYHTIPCSMNYQNRGNYLLTFMYIIECITRYSRNDTKPARLCMCITLCQWGNEYHPANRLVHACIYRDRCSDGSSNNEYAVVGIAQFMYCIIKHSISIPI